MGLYHGLIASEWDLTGMLLYVPIILMSIVSFPLIIRRRAFEFFYRFHWIMLSVILVMVFIHSGGISIVGVLLWIIDILIRYL